MTQVRGAVDDHRRDEAVDAQDTRHDHGNDGLPKPGQHSLREPLRHDIESLSGSKTTMSGLQQSFMIMSGRITPMDAMPTPDLAVP